MPVQAILSVRRPSHLDAVRTDAAATKLLLSSRWPTTIHRGHRLIYDPTGEKQGHSTAHSSIHRQPTRFHHSSELARPEPSISVLSLNHAGLSN